MPKFWWRVLHAKACVGRLGYDGLVCLYFGHMTHDRHLLRLVSSPLSFSLHQVLSLSIDALAIDCSFGPHQRDRTKS
jgi:hypothetical protein